MRRVTPSELADHLGRLAAPVVDALAPVRCVACERRIATASLRATTPFCVECMTALPWWRAADGCPRCGALVDESPSASDGACARCLAAGSPLHRCESVVRYEGDVTRWVPGFKRVGRRLATPVEPTRALAFLARALAERLARRETPIDVVVPAPSHWRRRLRRGFDPAEWLAERLAHHLDRPLVTNRLRRVRATPPQAALEGDARRANVRGAFATRARFDGEIRVGLVDDVLTTGSTLEAAADALLEAGAWEVRAITLAATRAPAARRPRDTRRGETSPPRRVSQPLSEPIAHPDPGRTEGQSEG